MDSGVERGVLGFDLWLEAEGLMDRDMWLCEECVADMLVNRVVILLRVSLSTFAKLFIFIMRNNRIFKRYEE